MSEDVKAHITGVVFQITAKAGDAVSAGEAIIVLESMKMEIPVLAEGSGVVTKMHVAEGDVVQEGDPIATIG